MFQQDASFIPQIAQNPGEWSGESCFGILYYGIREWYSQEGILYLTHAGEERTTSVRQKLSVACAFFRESSDVLHAPVPGPLPDALHAP